MPVNYSDLKKCARVWGEGANWHIIILKIYSAWLVVLSWFDPFEFDVCSFE